MQGKRMGSAAGSGFQFWLQHPMSSASLAAGCFEPLFLKQLPAPTLASLQPSTTSGQSGPLNSLDHVQSCPEPSDAPHLTVKNEGLALTHRPLRDLSDSSPNTVPRESSLLFLEPARRGAVLGPVSQGKLFTQTPPSISHLFRVCVQIESFATRPTLTTLTLFLLPAISWPLTCSQFF